MSKRFFAFGCSYTDYNWATWADLLCHHFHLEGFEVHNYGNSGMGNQHILDSLVHADIKHDLTDDDIICVLWSSWAREDRLWNFPANNGRVGFGKCGSVIQTDNPQVVNFSDAYFNLEQYIMKSITSIVAANRAYNIHYQAHITSNEEFNDDHKANGDELLKQFCNFTPENRFYNRSNSEYTQERKFYYDQIPLIGRYDGHPPPGSHLAFVKHQVAPALGIQLRKESIAWMKKEQKEVIHWEQMFDSGMAKDLYRSELEINKRKHLTFMKDWRYLWDSEQDGDPIGLNWGHVNNGILNGFKRAIEKKKLR